MDQKILFLDLDGTLLNDQKEITPGNRRAIGEALERGHRVVVTSGRPLKSSLAQARRLGLAGEGCFVIAYNGAVIYDCSAGTEILRRALERDVLYEVFDEARRRGVYVQTYDREDVVTEPWAAVDNAKRYCAVIGLEHRVIQDVRRDLEGQPVKALLIDYQRREPLEDMERWVSTALAGRADCFSSSPYFLEIVAPGMNKGAAVGALCAHLGVDLKNSVSAGDEGNDISMIRAAGVGVAMANAIPAVKDAADYITQRDNNHDGIEEVIRKFLL
ncbi:MAG: Cof-type HAD-IIB family hydrolase [Oscillospiraceae bacterium]|nr:Cof-type HAD-IIB family hydrolase [Oscillospiraceae bacterium]